jgi:hypothetical protein
MSGQPYVSSELAHFVGRELGSDEARCDLLVKILRDPFLTKRIPGMVPSRNWSGNMSFQNTGDLERDTLVWSQSVCFCDIPKSCLGIHIGKYGGFGLAFPKAFLVLKGARPVMYVPKQALIHTPRFLKPTMSIEDMIADRSSRARIDSRDEVALKADFERRVKEMDEDRIGAEKIVTELALRTLSEANKIFRPDSEVGAHEIDFEMLRHIFGYTKVFDASLAPDDPANFYMEREWRVIGNVEFEYSDLAYVFAPGTFHSQLATEFPDLADKLVDPIAG